MEKFNSAWRRLRRGNVSARAIALETQRRIRMALARRGERASLTALNEKPAQLTEHFARLSASALLEHFRSRTSPRFFPGFASAEQTAALQARLFPEETAGLLGEADAIASSHSWPLLGVYGRGFGEDEVDWNTDPLSGKPWPLSYHADINLIPNDGSDVRVLWELNRLGHFITLGRAYAVTRDEKFSTEFFRQLASWRAQNPVCLGVNWSCAMEVALRAMNLLAAFTLFLPSPNMSETELTQLLDMFDQHGAHIKRNLEFSYLGTSNHYLSDVIGLLWIGVMLPELKAARDWREWAFREMLSEMDKQILPDGAHYECSTGYHRFVLELLLYSFLLCRINGLEIEEKCWNKLRAMLEYVRAYLRPDGRAPLIGDTDGGQVMPIVKRSADDHAYTLALGAAIFGEANFKVKEQAVELVGIKMPAASLPEELVWILGEAGVLDYQSLPDGDTKKSAGFPDAGTFVLRDDDSYLLFNAGEVGLNGRGSHRHNDALSVEVSAYGSAFIVDPGTFVYTANLHERHLFRSTAYHSTVQVDDHEQRAILETEPFALGDSGDAAISRLEQYSEADQCTGRFSYRSGKTTMTHERMVSFFRRKRYWVILDHLFAGNFSKFSYRFHFAPGIKVTINDDGVVEARDLNNGSLLLLIAQGVQCEPDLEERYSSNNYAAKEVSLSVCWNTPKCNASFFLVPVSSGEDRETRLQKIKGTNS